LEALGSSADEKNIASQEMDLGRSGSGMRCGNGAAEAMGGGESRNFGEEYSLEKEEGDQVGSVEVGFLDTKQNKAGTYAYRDVPKTRCFHRGARRALQFQGACSSFKIRSSKVEGEVLFWVVLKRHLIS
jgi:hypothetical protein